VNGSHPSEIIIQLFLDYSLESHGEIILLRDIAGEPISEINCKTTAYLALPTPLFIRGLPRKALKPLDLCDRTLLPM